MLQIFDFAIVRYRKPQRKLLSRIKFNLLSTVMLTYLHDVLSPSFSPRPTAKPRDHAALARELIIIQQAEHGTIGLGKW